MNEIERQLRQTAREELSALLAERGVTIAGREYSSLRLPPGDGGSGAAVREAQENCLQVGFTMVRGISDSPPDAPAAAGSAPPNQTAQTDAWKKFASAMSASFLTTWVATE